MLFLCFVGPALLLTPVWTAIGTRVGKKRGYVAASRPRRRRAARRDGPLRAAVGRLRRDRAGRDRLRRVPGVPDGDAARRGSGRRAPYRINRAGVYTGVWTAGETLGLALGPGVFAMVLAIGGYRSSTDGDVVQPDSALTAITLGFSVLPALLIILSLLWLRRYSLDAAHVDVPTPTEEIP